MLDYSQMKQDYDQNGYLLLENFIPDDLLSRLSKVTQDFIDSACSGSTSNPSLDVISENGKGPGLRRIADPEKVHPVYDEAMRYPPLVELVAELLGGTVRFDHAKLNNKPPTGGGGILWHQDFAFYPQTNDDMLAIGVMIEDCTEENGAMMVVPGSHKLPMFDHHQDGKFVGGVNPASFNGLADNPVLLTGPAGSVSVHHCRLLHSSKTNQSDKDRPFLVLNYFAADAFPVFFSYDWDEFNSRLLVGNPVYSPRYRPVECKVPLPAKISGDEYITASLFDLQKELRL